VKKLHTDNVQNGTGSLRKQAERGKAVRRTIDWTGVEAGSTRINRAGRVRKQSEIRESQDWHDWMAGELEHASHSQGQGETWRHQKQNESATVKREIICQGDGMYAEKNSAF